MRGLIYKEWMLFFRSLDKKTMLLAGAVILLLLFRGEAAMGPLATVMLSLTIGIQHILSISNDEKANWKPYQRSMPVSSLCAVGSKYISVLGTVGISLAGGLCFNLLSSLLYRQFYPLLWGASMVAAFVIPLLWTSFCLPLAYWFGFAQAQVMGLLGIFPVFYLVKFFEDGPGLRGLSNTPTYYLLVSCPVAVIVFSLSFGISVLGYRRKA